jgi:hypothetical protein
MLRGDLCWSVAPRLQLDFCQLQLNPFSCVMIATENLYFKPKKNQLHHGCNWVFSSCTVLAEKNSFQM